ncbi:MAG: fasciclin domain-containing protein [Phormidesmis sp.]
MRFTFSSLSFSKLAGVAAALMILPVAVACDSQPEDTAIDTTTEEPAADTTAEAPAEDEMMTEGETIVDVASANGSFNTLVAAIDAAGLTETLSDEGPYTVFAPTDEAFAALPEGVLDQLLLPENQEVLAQILTYHVVAGEVPSGEVQTGMVPSVEGSDLDIVADGGSVMVNGANVVTPDVTASNGVIHVIDTVLLPPSVDPAAL